MYVVFVVFFTVGGVMRFFAKNPEFWQKRRKAKEEHEKRRSILSEEEEEQFLRVEKYLKLPQWWETSFAAEKNPN